MSARPTNTHIGIALLGGLVGVALGLLAAPGPGTETRRRMTGRISAEDQELLLRRAEMAAELPGDDLDLPAIA